MPSAPSSMVWPVLKRPLALVIAWKTPDSSRFTLSWRPSPDSVEMVRSEFCKMVFLLASLAQVFNAVVKISPAYLVSGQWSVGSKSGLGFEQNEQRAMLFVQWVPELVAIAIDSHQPIIGPTEVRAGFAAAAAVSLGYQLRGPSVTVCS